MESQVKRDINASDVIPKEPQLTIHTIVFTFR